MIYGKKKTGSVPRAPATITLSNKYRQSKTAHIQLQSMPSCVQAVNFQHIWQLPVLFCLWQWFVVLLVCHRFAMQRQLYMQAVISGCAATPPRATVANLLGGAKKGSPLLGHLAGIMC